MSTTTPARPRFRPGAALILAATVLAMPCLVVGVDELVVENLEAGRSWQVPASPARAEARWRGWFRGVARTGLRACLDVQGALVAASVGLGLLALARPRRPRPGPGHAAVAIAAVLIVYMAVQHALYRLGSGPRPAPTPGSYQAPQFLMFVWGLGSIPWTIAAGWALLAVLGAWTAPRDRAERVGRWIGWAWLATLAAQVTLGLLHRG